MPERREDIDGGALRRRAALLGCALLPLMFALQFGVDLLWPDAAFGGLVAALYAAAKLAGDRLAVGMVPQVAEGIASDWGHWLQVAVPAALIQAILLGLGVGVAGSLAALFPCAAYVAYLIWVRGDIPQVVEADTLGRRLQAWP